LRFPRGRAGSVLFVGGGRVIPPRNTTTDPVKRGGEQQPMPDQKDEFIPADQVSVSPRGRKKVLSADLLDTLRKVTPDRGVVLGGTFGKVAKADRGAVSATIRKHWREVRSDDVRIDYALDGTPQVRVRT